MAKEFAQLDWNADVEEDCRQLVRLAVREDLGRTHDWTTALLVGSETPGRAAVMARQSGVVAGLPAAKMVLAEMDPRVSWAPHVADGSRVESPTVLATIEGPARTLLTAERVLLNFVGHLSGIATLARQYVDAVAGTRARIYDTRKTLPGWRRLEKYAVRCGGAHNHRTGLFDAVLIKDNHLALAADVDGLLAGDRASTPAQAVRRVREFLAGLQPGDPRSGMIVEVEVESLEELEPAFQAQPDIVLLDNMPPELLREAVRRRDALAPGVELEASGGVNLASVAAIAASGVDRISVGALTHSAAWFDVALDWIA